MIAAALLVGLVGGCLVGWRTGIRAVMKGWEVLAEEDPEARQALDMLSAAINRRPR